MKGFPEGEEMLEIGTSERRNQPSPDGLHAPPVRLNGRSPRPTSFQPPDDHVSSGWPTSIAGRSDSQTLVDGQESRASLRSWQTGQQTPVDLSASPID
ncbi:Cellulose synthase catalytic subunit [UDP-forming], partial [Tolypocladium capitatum]